MPHQCTGCGHTFEDGSKEMLAGCPDCGGNKFQFQPAGETSGQSADQSPTDSGTADTGETSPTAEPPDPPGADSSSVAETVGRATTKVRDFVTPEPSSPGSDAEWPDEWEGSTSGSSNAPSSGGGAGSVSNGPEPPTPSDRVTEQSDSSDDEIIDADARREVETDDPSAEDVAQASARSDVVSPDELDDTVKSDTDTVDSHTDALTPGESLAESDEGSLEPEDEPASLAETSAPTDSDGEVVSEPTGDDPDIAALREQLNEQFESIKIVEPGQYELNLMELYDREEYIIALQENGRYVIQVPEQWIGEDPDDR